MPKEGTVQTPRDSRLVYLVIACLFGIVAIASQDRPFIATTLAAATLAIFGLLALIPRWLGGGIAPDHR
jgi:hypothetical protein